MASTRNNNKTIEYLLDQQKNKKTLNYNTISQHSKIQHSIPCAGINMGKMSGHLLSNNTTDIESFLLGINSTNLINNKKIFSADIKHLPSISFFKRNQPFLPKPLIIENCQRPTIFHR